ncbi:MAG: right-handed parallel beta-helix repeat-containing protein [Blastocatellia bacterium]
MKLFKSAGIAASFFALMLASAISVAAQGQLDPNVVESSREPASLSLTISTPGVYKLKRDIWVRSGDAITVTTDDVTIDLDGHTVSTRTAHTGRGVFINGATGVKVVNGRISGFAANVMVMNSVNVKIENLQIAGGSFQPGLNGDGPSEIGIALVNTRASVIKANTISSVNLGIFVRGNESTGNRIVDNTVVGGSVPANNLLGICYNPAAGEDAATQGPRGDLIYNNHIARFGFAIAISAGSVNNIFRGNNLASFSGGFREANALTAGGGTNLSVANQETQIPVTTLARP